MNIAMKLTMQGLIRALQSKGHALAEEAERGARRRAGRQLKPQARPNTQSGQGGKNADGRR